MRSDRRTMILAALAVLGVLAMAGLVALIGRTSEAQGSSISRGPAGWLAARKYLEARGAKVTLWREPLDRLTGRGVLVVTFPWQHGAALDAADLVNAHLQRGGNVVLASGTASNPGELVVLEALGLAPDEVRKAPLGPFAWRKFVREEWELTPPQTRDRTDPTDRSDHRVRVWAPRHMPELPKNPEVLYETPTGRPAVVRLKRYRGSIWLLPADALANARLGETGNADLLETLLARLGRQWTFDEYHHGLVAVEAAGDKTFLRIIDLVLIHLAILYLLAALTLARRFGPPWREPPVVTGSVGSFLLGLGMLHHRLGHHGEAARRLLERIRELSPDLIIPEGLARRAETAGPRDLVEVARRVVEIRRGDRPIPSASASGDRK